VRRFLYCTSIEWCPKAGGFAPFLVLRCFHRHFFPPFWIQIVCPCLLFTLVVELRCVFCGSRSASLCYFLWVSSSSLLGRAWPVPFFSFARIVEVMSPTPPPLFPRVPQARGCPRNLEHSFFTGSDEMVRFGLPSTFPSYNQGFFLFLFLEKCLFTELHLFVTYRCLRD